MRAAIDALLALPRAEQPDAVRALLERWPRAADEPWNTAFGADSLYHAFTRTTAARGVHAANRAALAPRLRPGFRVIEVGGGDGALWEGLLGPEHRGTIVVVDPHPEGADGVRRAAPAGVEVEHLRAPVQAASLPDADAAVASLVLHHIAGADAAQRAAVGLDGAGKLEALRALRDAVAPRDGRVLINEADVYCDLGLAPGDPLLLERLTDSYVRRWGRSLLDDLDTCADPALAARWRAMLRDWALGQVHTAGHAAWADRDVYELDVVSWLGLFARAGLRVEARGFTDRWMLFHRYLLAPA